MIEARSIYQLMFLGQSVVAPALAFLNGLTRGRKTRFTLRGKACRAHNDGYKEPDPQPAGFSPDLTY